MSFLSNKPHQVASGGMSFPTPLLLGLEFSERHVVVENEMDELERIHKKNDWVYDLQSTERYLTGKDKAVIVTDIHQHIIWTSRGFVRMTGYTYCEAFHRKPTFLQGPLTHESTIMEIRKALTEGKVFEGSIVNYRKSGSVYSCQVTIMPIFNSQNRLMNFIALEEEKKGVVVGKS
jgi:PAS domain S-box-containing protein